MVVAAGQSVDRRARAAPGTAPAQLQRPLARRSSARSPRWRRAERRSCVCDDGAAAAAADPQRPLMCGDAAVSPAAGAQPEP